MILAYQTAIVAGSILFGEEFNDMPNYVRLAGLYHHLKD